MSDLNNLHNSENLPDGADETAVGRGKSESSPPVLIDAARIRRRLYVKGLLEGKTKAQAARDAGFAESTAYNAKQKIDNHPEVQAEFKGLLEQVGITDELLAELVLDGLGATETKLFAHEGVVIDHRELIAWGERRAMLELAIKLKGLKPAEQINHHVTLEQIVGGRDE